jgi:hypothetical protein
MSTWSGLSKDSALRSNVASSKFHFGEAVCQRSGQSAATMSTVLAPQSKPAKIVLSISRAECRRASRAGESRQGRQQAPSRRSPRSAHRHRSASAGRTTSTSAPAGSSRRQLRLARGAGRCLFVAHLADRHGALAHRHQRCPSSSATIDERSRPRGGACAVTRTRPRLTRPPVVLGRLRVTVPWMTRLRHFALCADELQTFGRHAAQVLGPRRQPSRVGRSTRRGWPVRCRRRSC